jgi:hypothetical protein
MTLYTRTCPVPSDTFPNFLITLILGQGNHSSSDVTQSLTFAGLLPARSFAPLR